MNTPSDDTKRIIKTVARLYRVKASDLMGRRRLRPIVRARQAAMREVARAKPHLSTSQIGRIFGYDHSTVLWALGRRHQRGKWVDQSMPAVKKVNPWVETLR